jgi:hypothetical protein
MRAFAPMAGVCLGAMLLKFVTNEDCQAVLRGRKGLDKDLTPVQQARKSKLWPLFKEAKVISKCTF